MSTRIFLSTVLLPKLCANAARGTKLLRGSPHGPGSCNDHPGPRKTRQKQAELCVWPLAPTKPGEDPPHRLPRLSRPLHPVWGQRLFSHRDQTHLPTREAANPRSPGPATPPYLWRAAPRSPWWSWGADPLSPQQSPRCSAIDLFRLPQKSSARSLTPGKNPPIWLAGHLEAMIG